MSSEYDGKTLLRAFSDGAQYSALMPRSGDVPESVKSDGWLEIC